MTKPCHSPHCECSKNKCTHPGFHDARHLTEEPKMTNPGSTLPTTQVTAYVATDGSLWLNENECLAKNQQLKDQKLYSHINNCCCGAGAQTADTSDILEYILEYFDEIKTTLEK